MPRFRLFILFALIATAAAAKWTPLETDANWTRFIATPLHSVDGLHLGLGQEHRDFVRDQVFFRIAPSPSRLGLRFASMCRIAPILSDIREDFGNDTAFDFEHCRLSLRDSGHAETISSEKNTQLLKPPSFASDLNTTRFEGGEKTRDAMTIAAGQLLDEFQSHFADRNSSESGLHAGLVNLSRENLIGAQVGLVNAAYDWKGLQIGLVNRSRRGTGLQIGLVNFADSKTEIISPIVFSARF